MRTKDRRRSGIWSFGTVEARGKMTDGGLVDVGSS